MASTEFRTATSWWVVYAGPIRGRHDLVGAMQHGNVLQTGASAAAEVETLRRLSMLGGNVQAWVFRWTNDGRVICAGCYKDHSEINIIDVAFAAGLLSLDCRAEAEEVLHRLSLEDLGNHPLSAHDDEVIDLDRLGEPFASEPKTDQDGRPI